MSNIFLNLKLPSLRSSLRFDLSFDYKFGISLVNAGIPVTSIPVISK